MKIVIARLLAIELSSKALTNCWAQRAWQKTISVILESLSKALSKSSQVYWYTKIPTKSSICAFYMMVKVGKAVQNSKIQLAH